MASTITTPTTSDRSPITSSHVDTALLLVRLVVGVIFMAHGAQKLFGLWGGPGLQGIMGPQGPGGGGIVGLLVGIGEFFGGLGIAVGFLSRFSSAINILIMVVAIATVHGKNGFFSQDKGFEYNLALIGLLLPILIAGPGRYAMGRFLPLPKVAGTDRPIRYIE